MTPKGRFYLIKLERVGFAAANILKQEMLAKGGEAAISGSIYFSKEETTDALLLTTERTLKRVIQNLKAQPLPSLQEMAQELSTALDQYTQRYVAPSCRIGSREFFWGERTYIMGIINVTPDSFSGDGLLRDASPAEMIDKAVEQALAFIDQGADIIDIGGESTRPGASPIGAETERARTEPVIRKLRTLTDVPISIDTYKAPVAEAALDAGADLVNDVWGLQMDPRMGPLVARRAVPVVLMHNRSKPKNAAQEDRLGGRYIGIHYDDLMADILRELRQLVAQALQFGIAPEQIIIDPGIGFGKTVEQNLQLLNHLDELRVLGFPILLGPSRKSFIGYTLDLPPEERLEGTAAAVAVSIVRNGADIVRVHDVQAIARVAKMTDAIVRAGYR
ncbi:MAG: dihydropteroate synthase [Anaerolineae bacterium]|nr:dihydropteroate synthase [Anaerolineae bacterium]